MVFIFLFKKNAYICMTLIKPKYMNNKNKLHKNLIQLLKKKLKKSNKWLQKFGDYDMGHLDKSFLQVRATKKLCKKILKFER